MKELKKIYLDFREIGKSLKDGTASPRIKDLILNSIWIEMEDLFGAAPPSVKRKGRPPLSRKLDVVKAIRKKFSEINKESKKAKEVEEKV
jgi:hypothetical protein